MTDWLVGAAQIGLAGVLAVAAIAKLQDPDSFRAALGASPLTRRWRGPLTVAVPAAELTLAAALVLVPDAAVPVALALVAGLMLAFCVWLASVLARGVQASCACFGPAERRIGPWTIARNVALAAVAAGAAIAAAGAGGGLGGETLARAVVFTTSALLAALITGFTRARPQLVLRRDEITEEGSA